MTDTTTIAAASAVAAAYCGWTLAKRAAAAAAQPKNTLWITVQGSGTPECDGLYCPSTEQAKVSESGTVSALGYWNSKMAWDRVDGKAKRSPSLSYSNSYKQWRICTLDGHLAYSVAGGESLTPPSSGWTLYTGKSGKAAGPAPSVTLHPAAPKPNVVFVNGGPGAGKGTSCELCSLQLGWTHISAGDLLRAERKKGGERGDMIEKICTEGGIVPSAITVALLQAEMEKVVAENGKLNFLIDGFPRNQENEDAWVEVVGAKSNVVSMLFFECPLAELERRIMGRAQYSGRKDDNIESLRKRFKTYKDDTMPIVELYRSRGQCTEVDSSQAREAVYAKVKAVLAPHTDAALADAPLTRRSQQLLGLIPFDKKKN